MNKELTNNEETGWLFRGLAIGCCLFFGIISCVLDNVGTGPKKSFIFTAILPRFCDISAEQLMPAASHA